MHGHIMKYEFKAQLIGDSSELWAPFITCYGPSFCILFQQGMWFKLVSSWVF